MNYQDWVNLLGTEKILFLVGLSGGKDSSAVDLWLTHESDIPRGKIVRAFCDTQNEDPLTYEHLKTLSRATGPHVTLTPPLGFYDLAYSKRRFPSTRNRFCTQDLKMKPTLNFANRLERKRGHRVVMVSGVRADESEERARLGEVGEPLESYFGRYEWRPLIRWQIEDVYLLHRRHGLSLNPLYSRGARRVGCFPCINSAKHELRLAAKMRPEKIEFIAGQEEKIGRERGNFGIATFFASNKTPKSFRTREVVTKDGRRVRLATIRDVAAWARTGKGGHNTLLFDDADVPLTCDAKWGACE